MFGLDYVADEHQRFLKSVVYREADFMGPSERDLKLIERREHQAEPVPPRRWLDSVLVRARQVMV